MIIGPSPFKVVKTRWHTWFSEGPYQSGNQWKTEGEALKECDLLNSVYNSGYFAKVDQRRLAELESDVANAYTCAKKHVPDYPWAAEPDKSCQASTAVWACGTAYEGVSKACEDWRRLFAHLAPEAYASLMEMTKNNITAYELLMKEIQNKAVRTESVLTDQ